MKRQPIPRRISKIGGQAALATAIGLMFGAANAQNVFLGTQYGGVTSSTDLFDAEVGTSPSYRHLEGPNAGDDNWNSTEGAPRSYLPSTSRGGDVYYQSSVIYWVRGAGGEDIRIDKDLAEAARYRIDGGTSMTASAERTAAFLENRFYSIEDSNQNNNYFVGNGAEVSAVSRGRNAYAELGPINGAVGPEWFDVGFRYNAGKEGGESTPFAINVAGDTQFDGNNTVNGDIKAANHFINGANVRFNSASVEGNIVFSTAGSLYINGSSQGGSTVVGDVGFAQHDGSLTLAHMTTIEGSVTGTGTDNASMSFEGDGTVEGDVGPIKSLNVLGNGSLVQLNTVSGKTSIHSLNVSADLAAVRVNGLLTGNVQMGGHYSKLVLLDRADAGGANGMKGVLDFGMYKSSLGLAAPDVFGSGTLEIGNNVNVTFSNDPSKGIMLINADNATLLFAGNSNVTGVIGSANAGDHNTPYRIYAGAANSTVTFNDRVHVGAGDLHVGPGTSTVSLLGGLTGNLVFGTGTPVSTEGTAYSAYGDGGVGGTWGNAGTAEVGDGETVTGSITTLANGTGILRFRGASAYPNNIGTANERLASVQFNSATPAPGTAGAPVQSTIAGDVHANKVWIGNGAAFTTATLTPGAHRLGEALELVNGNTTLNLIGATTTKNADGTLANAGTASATVGL